MRCTSRIAQTALAVMYLAVFLAPEFEASAQDSSTVTLSGRASLSAEYYSYSTEPTPFFYARRPANLYRLVATPELRWKSLSMPITLVLSSQQTNFSTSISSDQSFTQFIQNPMNILSAEPQWKWGTAHLGSYTPHWSDLSVGDVQIFGIGIDLRPERYRVSAFTGVSQGAIEPFSYPTALNQFGAYKRTISGLKLGFGTESRGYVDVNIVHSVDDTSSVVHAPADTLIRPQEALLLSINSRIVLDTGMYVGGEIAANNFTRNVRSVPTTNNDLPTLPGFAPLISSTYDYAASASFGLTKRNYGLIIQGKYIGDGFHPIGYPNMLSDRLEATLQPRILLDNGNVQGNASIGYRVNNLHSNQATQLSQFIMSANASYLFNEHWNFSASFSNFGVRNTVSSDSFRIQNVSQYLSLTPTYSFHDVTGFHTVSLTAAVDDYTDYNVLSQRYTTNKTTTLFASYMLSMTTLPVNASGSLSYIHNNLPYADLSIVGFNTSASYRMFNNVLVPGLRLCYTHNAIGPTSTDVQLLFGVSCTYRLNAKTSVNFNASLNKHSFGPQNPSSYTEHYLQTMISMQF